MKDLTIGKIQQAHKDLKSKTFHRGYTDGYISAARQIEDLINPSYDCEEDITYRPKITSIKQLRKYLEKMKKEKSCPIKTGKHIIYSTDTLKELKGLYG